MMGMRYIPPQIRHNLYMSNLTRLNMLALEIEEVRRNMEIKEQALSYTLFEAMKAARKDSEDFELLSTRSEH